MPDPSAPPSTDPFERARLAQTVAFERRRRRRSRHTPRPQPEVDLSRNKPQADDTSRANPCPHRATHANTGSPTQIQGRDAEDRAARYLQAQGLRLLARNLRCKAGEIDLVALEGAVLVFIEVRERGTMAFGGAAASVNRRKQRRLFRAANHFLPWITGRYLQGRTPRCRFDVICIQARQIEWLTGAFS